MTYFNANVYRDTVTQWAHDDCLPDSEFHVYPNGHRQQRQPWHWAPIYGAAKPCHYCGRDVQ